VEDLHPKFIREHYEVKEWRHACAILKTDFPEQWEDITTVLSGFRLKTSAIMAPGGSKSDISKQLDGALTKRGWKEVEFNAKMIVEDETLETRTHKIDCYKNRVGLEIEWNSKDQTFDRDLRNYRFLFDINRLSVGVIVTRTDELQALFKELKQGAKYGAATTHMSKLLPRMTAGAAGGCPILVFGISRKLYVEESREVVQAALERYKREKSERESGRRAGGPREAR
jgi:hypothetical protein